MIRRDGEAFRVEGPVTIANVEALLAEGLRLFEGQDIRVDLAGITEVDSSAVSLLLEWSRDAAHHGRRLTFLNLDSNLKSLATLYGVSTLIPAA